MSSMTDVFHDLEPLLRRAQGVEGRRTSVYFATDHAGDRVKIGISDRPLQRVRNLEGSAGVPLFVTTVFRAPTSFEKELHGYLAGDKIQGEWFRRSERVKDAGAVLQSITDERDRIERGEDE